MTSNTQQTILVVEDDPTTSEILRILLEDTGCRIVTALSGRDAIDNLRRDPPNLITLDMRLPDLDGSEILSLLSADDQLSTIPVIVVSGRSISTQSAPQIVAVLPKPFDAAELELAIRRHLRPSIRPVADGEKPA
jgi:CheY-like chemotaxis protein